MPHAELRKAIDALPGKDKPGGGRMARCPVHDDDKASLSVDYANGGQVLLNCHAGCQTEDIVAALGGSMADLFPDSMNGMGAHVRIVTSPSRRQASPGERRFDAFYTDGTKAGLHCRSDDGRGRKRIWWDPQGVRVKELALFGSWDMSDSGPIVVVEGERATLAVRAAGIDAVGTYGSGAMPTDEALAPLQGRDVVLWADTDDSGKKHMDAIAEALGGTVRRVRPPGGSPKGWDAADADADLIRSLVEEASEPRTGPNLRQLSDYVSEPVQWLWPGWLPEGTVTLFDGNPGEAKSTTVMSLIACVTTRLPWPDGQDSGEPGDVLIITREDDPSRVLRPRLEVAGADLDRVYFLEDEFVMPSDAEQLRLAIGPRIRLVFIDPLFSHIEGRIKTISDNDIRTAVMTPLSTLAAETGVALLAMRHNSKDTSKSALLRGAGSLGGLAGAARSMWGAAPDPDDDDGTHKLFGVTKSNYARKPQAYRYRVVSAVPEGEVWVGHSVSKVEWMGASELSIDDVLSEEDHDTARDAAEVIVAYLESQGGSSAATAGKAHMKSKGFGSAAIKAAKRRARIRSAKDGFDSGWTWNLPEGDGSDPFDPFEEVAADPFDPFGEEVGGGLPPTTSTPSTPSTTSKESKGSKGSKERTPPAHVRALEPSRARVECRDYSAHQSSHRRVDADHFACDICDPPEEET